VVRDSIKILVGRGILGVKRGAGTFVRASEQYSAARLNQMLEVIPLKDSGLRDLFEVRKVLESEGACWAAQRRSSTNVEHLRRILEGAESCSENLEVVSEKDGQFHVGVAEASQNPVQVRVMYALLDLLEKARKESMKLSGRVELSLQQHFAILESIESSDGEGARLAMLAHLTSVEKDILALRRDQQY
jgi:GntR family transcriptional regulator, transcriptional repressor for pyruvate dehydrogenase complex